MADHFEEVVNLRISGIEQRLGNLEEVVRLGFAATFAELGRIKGRMDGIEGRMDGLEGRMERIETKLDSYLSRALLALEDIQRRLPPGA